MRDLPAIPVKEVSDYLELKRQASLERRNAEARGSK